jgi:hypothetical protein
MRHSRETDLAEASWVMLNGTFSLRQIQELTGLPRSLLKAQLDILKGLKVLGINPALTSWRRALRAIRTVKG